MDCIRKYKHKNIELALAENTTEPILIAMVIYIFVLKILD